MGTYIFGESLSYTPDPAVFAERCLKLDWELGKSQDY